MYIYIYTQEKPFIKMDIFDKNQGNIFSAYYK